MHKKTIGTIETIEIIEIIEANTPKHYLKIEL